MNNAQARASLSRLAQLLEVQIVDLLVDAGDFLQHVEDLERRGLGIASSRGPCGSRLTLEPFPLPGARAACAGPADLAVYAYAWTLRQVAAGRVIYAVDWRAGTAGPVDLGRFRTAVLVRHPTAP